MRFSFLPLYYFPNRLGQLISCYGRIGYRSVMVVGILMALVMVGGVTLALQDGGSSSLSTGNLLHRIEVLEASNEEIGKRFSQAEQGLADQLANNRLALAIFQLRIASQTHLPFESELSLVRQMSRNEPGLSKTLAILTPHAAVGIATVAELRDGFGLILIPKLQPLLEQTDQNWVNWAFSWVNMVFIPFSSSQPNPRQQLVISATDRLTEDDLRGAVELIERLDGPAAALVVRWLKEANARLTVDAVYNALSGIALALLGQTE
ncbi:hypothetical protein CCP3SC5AM1_950008 [Gammaproteobacteria bacterium]